MDQIERMHALIGQLAAAGEFGIAAPLLFVARTTAVAIPDAKVDEPPYCTLAKAFAGAPDRRMIAMVEPDLEQLPAAFGDARQRACFVEIATHRFLDQDVFTALEGTGRNLGQELVRRRDDDDIDVRGANHFFPATDGARAKTNRKRL